MSDRLPKLRPKTLSSGDAALEPASFPGNSLDRLLFGHFGIERFRPWQREAVEALIGLAGAPPTTRNVLVVAPTGGGKSLCYQFPAAVLPGTALVLSPLISLMEDQVRGLLARGIPATFLASTLPRDENARRLAAILRGDYKIVYAAPERLASEGFLEALSAIDLSLVAVDEAHCIVQWGHEFRPDYLRIGAALGRIRAPRAIACTATATPDAREEILRQLGWDASRSRVILRGFARPNLHLGVEEVSGAREALRVTDDALRDTLGPPAAPRGAGIIYSATRRGAERLADDLRQRGWDAAAYHAGLAPEARAELSGAFAERRISVVVATNAFGMGIDRPDVRLVVHAQPPSSIEAYYQEVGRAGRDGAPAHGLLLIAGADIALRRRLCMASAEGPPVSAAEAARAWGLFRELLRYVDAATCRHDFILRHFGDEAESLGGCGHCDVCLDVGSREEADPASLERDLETLRKALSGVARARGGAGMAAIASMLSGEPTARVVRLGLDRLSTFGIMKERSPEDAMAVLRALLANGWIDLSDSEYPVPLITRAGWSVMRGEREVRVKLLPPGARRRRKKVPAWRKALVESAVAKEGEGAAAGLSGAKSLSARDAALFEALRSYRAGIAKEEGVPPYVIAPDRTLIEVAVLRPRTPEELRSARGMGPGRVASYGDAILKIVKAQAAPEDRWEG
ncbi:MAG: ATP-dependent DNA helicase [Polyangiaceae bacterium]|nr:ATP-dependent DNA helicase [Polyangiaceae bacterium]